MFEHDNCFTFTESKDPPCVGVYFRYSENNYSTDNGVKFVFQKQISLLRKMSCTGCSKCGWVLDDAYQGMCERGRPHFEFASGIKHGDIVTIMGVVDSRDWETSYVDDWHLKVVKATPPQSSIV